MLEYFSRVVFVQRRGCNIDPIALIHQLAACTDNANFLQHARPAINSETVGLPTVCVEHASQNI